MSYIAAIDKNIHEQNIVHCYCCATECFQSKKFVIYICKLLYQNYHDLKIQKQKFADVNFKCFQM